MIDIVKKIAKNGSLIIAQFRKIVLKFKCKRLTMGIFHYKKERF